MKPGQLVVTPEVLDALNGELAYQSKMQDSGRADNTDHGVAGQLVTLNTYARNANDAWTMNSGEEEALANLRKVAAIAIRALVLYGCPTR